MISDIHIEIVEHPRSDLMRKMHKPTKYLALTFKKDHCESHMNMDYVEETLEQDVRAKFITTVEYLELLSRVRDYKRKVSNNGKVSERKGN